MCNTDRTHRYQIACPVGAESHLQIPHRLDFTPESHQRHDGFHRLCMHVLFASEQMKQPQTWVFSSHTGYFLLDMEIFCQCCRGWWCKQGGRNLGASGPCVCPELMPCSMVPMDVTYQTQGQRSNDQESQDGGSRVLNQAWRPGRLHRSPASEVGDCIGPLPPKLALLESPGTQPVLAKCFLSK